MSKEEIIIRILQSLQPNLNKEDKWLKEILDLGSEEEGNILSNSVITNDIDYWNRNKNRETILNSQEEIQKQSSSSTTEEEEIRKEIELILGGSIEEWIVDSEQAEHFRKFRNDEEFISSSKRQVQIQKKDLYPKIQIIGLENMMITTDNQLLNHQLFVCGVLKHGASSISQTAFTKMIPCSQHSPQWNEFLTFDILLSDLPRETTICLTIFSRNDSSVLLTSSNTPLDSDIPIGYLILPIFDFKGLLKQGEFLSEIWPSKMTSTSFPIENKASQQAIFIRYRLDFNSDSNSDFNSDSVEEEFTEEGINERMEESFELFEEKIRNIPLSLTQEERWLLWLNREYLIEYPNALYKFILSVPWTLPKGVQIAHSLIPKWKINPIDTLELLSLKIADSKVRQFALKKLDELDNSQLINILYPLVQSLKYNGDGILARNAQINMVSGLYVTKTNDIYLSDTRNHRIRMIKSDTGIISTIVGNGTIGTLSQGKMALETTLNQPTSLFVDESTGEIYFIDYGNNAIRKVNNYGYVITIAISTDISHLALNNNEVIFTSKSGCYRMEKTGVNPTSYPAFGKYFIVKPGTLPLKLMISSSNEIFWSTFGSNTIVSVAGDSVKGFSQDSNNRAEYSHVNNPTFISELNDETYFFSDTGNNIIRQLKSTCENDYALKDGKCYPTCNGRLGSDACNGQGECNSPNTCSCNDRYMGPNCGQLRIYCGGQYGESACGGSGRGICAETNRCTCKEGYSGEYCQSSSIQVSKSNSMSDSTALIVGLVVGCVLLCIVVCCTCLITWYVKMKYCIDPPQPELTLSNRAVPVIVKEEIAVVEVEVISYKIQTNH